MDAFSEISSALKPYFDGLYRKRYAQAGAVAGPVTAFVHAKVFHYDE